MNLIKKWLVSGICLMISQSILAQDAVGYQLPPKEIADLLLAKPTPGVSIDSKAQWLLQSERNSYPTVEELGQPEIRIAGLRLNPNNFSPSRQSYINRFVLKNIPSGKEYSIDGIPANLLAGAAIWNPSETKFAFTNNTANNIDLYVVDIASHQASKWNQHALNLVLGSGFAWLDDQTIIYKSALHPAAMAPKNPSLPKDPPFRKISAKPPPVLLFRT